MDVFARLLGSRPNLTLVIDEARIAEIWVEGRAPTITLRDYDWGKSDPDPCRDAEGFPSPRSTGGAPHGRSACHFTRQNRRPSWHTPN